ncbi:acyltransferase family protein [Pararhizobium sp. IMCC21322]|uniref:acyltransferase family protein n=1 Tax=Pararhizobium sp. IMCC21322 TaxID=3067903 RepID=UPI00274131DC|nr:acyltransferase family protein [Pararhizobium sp. IMCC21322]
MSNIQSGNKDRLHHWDFSWALYLMLGIPFHAAVIYSLAHEWAVSSPDKSQVLTWLSSFLHTFRMPGFFLLAGFFSIMLLDRKGPMIWLKSRLFRLGVPLFSATLLILPFQIVVQSVALSVNGTLPWADLSAYTTGQLTQFGEPWISHLWFLWSLIAYCVGLAMLHALVGGANLRAALDGLVGWVTRNRIASFIGFAGLCAATAYVQSVVVAASPYYGNAVINYNAYILYFCLGVILFHSSKMQDLLVKPGPTAACVGIVLAVLSVFPYTDLLGHTLNVIAGIAGALLIVGYISNLAVKHFNRPNAKVRKLVDASFTIYLFHHPIIFVLATLFLLVNLPPIIEFVIIAVVAGVSSYAIHQLISKSSILSMMLGSNATSRSGRSLVKVTG